MPRRRRRRAVPQTPPEVVQASSKFASEGVEKVTPLDPVRQRELRSALRGLRAGTLDPEPQPLPPLEDVVAQVVASTKLARQAEETQ